MDEVSLTKICIVGSGSAEEAREEMEDIDETLLERIVAVMLRRGSVSVAIAR